MRRLFTPGNAVIHELRKAGDEMAGLTFVNSMPRPPAKQKVIKAISL